MSLNPAAPPPPRPFAAILLAGGASSRMGVDKAGLLLNGRPLWARQLDVLRELAPTELFISGRPAGPYAAAGVEIVPDVETGLGPLLGVRSVLERATCAWVLILAIDLPHMPAAYLRILLDAALSRGKGQIPYDGERFEPLAAVYPRACLAVATRFWHERRLSMQELVRAAEGEGLVERHPIETGQEIYFVNVNTLPEAREAGLTPSNLAAGE